MTDFFFEERGLFYRKNEFIEGRQTLVFIHGLSGSSSAWLPYETFFISTHNLLFLDLRGHGKSLKPSRREDYALSYSVTDVNALLNQLHIEKCILISHSFGVLVALSFIAVHPEKVSRTVFLSPVAELQDTTFFPIVRLLAKAGSVVFRLLPSHQNRYGHVDYRLFLHTGDWNILRIMADIRITTIRTYFYCLAHLYVRNYDELWKQVHIPTLIIHGKKDSIIPTIHAVHMAEKIADSKLVLLEEANHVIVLNNVPEVAQYLRNFSF